MTYKGKVILISIILIQTLFVLSGCESYMNSATLTYPDWNVVVNKTNESPYAFNILPVNIIKYADILDKCITPVITISPDAEWGASYDCQINNSKGLWVWKIGEQKATLLFPSDINGNAHPYFSPDSKKLLVISQKHEWWLFDVGEWTRGALLLSETTRTATPFWSPDSQSIAVKDLKREWALSILYLDGTYTNLLTYGDMNSDSDMDWYLYNEYSWSPDSKKIAYTPVKGSEGSEPIQLWTVDVLTGKREQIYQGKTGEFGYRPNWSPDGKNILFVNSGLENQQYESIYNIMEKTFTKFADFEYNYSAKWSPDGKYFSIEDDQGLYLYSIDSGKFYYLHTHARVLTWKDDNTIVIQENDYDLYLIIID